MVPWVGLQYVIVVFPSPEVIKLFSCSTQLSIKFQLLRKTKMLKNKDLFCFKPSDVVFIMLINVKMPTTIVGILTFMSMINFILLITLLKHMLWIVKRVVSMR